MNIVSQLSFAYVKTKRLLNSMTIDEILNYITQNTLIDMTNIRNINKYQYPELFNIINNYCKKVDNRNSCLISSIIFANIMSYLNESVNLNIGFVSYFWKKYAHAWIDIIELSPYEIECIIKTYPIQKFYH